MNKFVNIQINQISDRKTDLKYGSKSYFTEKSTVYVESEIPQLFFGIGNFQKEIRIPIKNDAKPFYQSTP